MLAGTLIMENCMLTFSINSNGATYTVADHTNGQETRTVTGDAFTKALAIAIHWDGNPNAEQDYPAAESVQPVNKELRWIP